MSNLLKHPAEEGLLVRRWAERAPYLAVQSQAEMNKLDRLAESIAKQVTYANGDQYVDAYGILADTQLTAAQLLGLRAVAGKDNFRVEHAVRDFMYLVEAFCCDILTPADFDSCMQGTFHEVEVVVSGRLRAAAAVAGITPIIKIKPALFVAPMKARLSKAVIPQLARLSPRYGYGCDLFGIYSGGGDKEEGACTGTPRVNVATLVVDGLFVGTFSDGKSETASLYVAGRRVPRCYDAASTNTLNGDAAASR